MSPADPAPEDNTAFLGTGWAFPPSFSGQGAAMVSGEEDIRQALEILLSTALGERIMRPDFGCDLHRLAFEPFDATQRTFVKDLIEEAILLHEPRIVLENVSVEQAEGRNDTLLIGIEYLVTSTNSRVNLVLPFYLEEGTVQP